MSISSNRSPVASILSVIETDVSLLLVDLESTAIATPTSFAHSTTSISVASTMEPSYTTVTVISKLIPTFRANSVVSAYTSHASITRQASSTSTSTATMSSLSAASSNHTLLHRPDTQGLTPAAIAGICAGLALFMGINIIAALYFWSRHRSKHTQAGNAAYPESAWLYDPPIEPKSSMQNQLLPPLNSILPPQSRTPTPPGGHSRESDAFIGPLIQPTVRRDRTLPVLPKLSTVLSSKPSVYRKSPYPTSMTSRYSNVSQAMSEVDLSSPSLSREYLVGSPILASNPFWDDDVERTLTVRNPETRTNANGIGRHVRWSRASTNRLSFEQGDDGNDRFGHVG